MKKALILILAALLLSGSAFAADFAVSKGAMILQGTVAFEQRGGDLYENADGDAETVIDFQPALDYFLMNNLFVGGTISFASESQGDISMSEMGIGPEVGYALGKAESKIFPYGKLGVMYRSNSFDNGTHKVTATGTDLFIGVGVIFAVKEHIGITPELSYHMRSLKSDVEGAEAVDGTVIRLGVGISGLIW